MVLSPTNVLLSFKKKQWAEIAPHIWRATPLSRVEALFNLKPKPEIVRVAVQEEKVTYNLLKVVMPRLLNHLHLMQSQMNHQGRWSKHHHNKQKNQDLRSNLPLLKVQLCHLRKT